MILMYHHVCPRELIPDAQAPLEGWKYNIEPAAFESQLRTLVSRGYRFVTLQNYLASMKEPLFSSLATVTFDDGWTDNFRFAFPMLAAMQIPATLFVVSGEMTDVSRSRRMAVAELRQCSEYGVTIGAHTRTHPNLARLQNAELHFEIAGSKVDLEDLLGYSVNYLAYPGGRFNQRVVDVTQEVGFQAACSVISWGINSDASRFWLYRYVFSDELNHLSDRLRLNRWSRRLLSWRAGRALRKMLEAD